MRRNPLQSLDIRPPGGVVGKAFYPEVVGSSRTRLISDHGPFHRPFRGAHKTGSRLGSPLRLRAIGMHDCERLSLRDRVVAEVRQGSRSNFTRSVLEGMLRTRYP